MRRYESPRFIRTHLPLSLLPKSIWYVQPKVSECYDIRNNCKKLIIVVGFYFCEFHSYDFMTLR